MSDLLKEIRTPPKQRRKRNKNKRKSPLVERIPRFLASCDFFYGMQWVHSSEKVGSKRCPFGDHQLFKLSPCGDLNTVLRSEPFRGSRSLTTVDTPRCLEDGHVNGKNVTLVIGQI